ncbi:MAG TPA: hypothetical protein VGQ71_06500 [Terriglobales bacterium]|nr:hypothetical protein [Terriglobales bacterium]
MSCKVAGGATLVSITHDHLDAEWHGGLWKTTGCGEDFWRIPREAARV